MTDPSPPGMPPGHVTIVPDQPGPGAATPPDASGPPQVTGRPPAFPPAETLRPGATAVTGRRVVAALIDTAVLLGLLVILSQIVGRTSPEVGGIRASIRLGTITRFGRPPVDIGLYGAWAMLYGAITLAYYFTLEAAAGQTVGKALLGLRVGGRDGGRARPGAIAGRTVLRAIDGLPLLYLVGYVSVLATGARRARLGDLAAGTAVMRARPAHPARRRALAAAVLTAVLATAAGLPTYRLLSPGGPQTYRGHGVSFTYPAGWQQVPASDLRPAAHAGAATWTAALALGPHDLILLEALPQDPPVTAATIASFASGFGQELRQYLGQAGWSAQAGPERVTLGGMPALEAWISGRTPGGAAVSTLDLHAYRGATGYHLACQHTPGHARQVAQACAQVMRTFTVAGLPPPPAGAPSATPFWFRTGAQVICEQTIRQIPPAPPGRPSPAQLAAGLGRLAASLGHVLARLATVEAPAAWQYPFWEFLAHTGQLHDAVASAAQHLRDGDLAAARAQWHAARAAITRIRHDSPWLSTHGLGTCTMLAQLR